MGLQPANDIYKDEQHVLLAIIKLTMASCNRTAKNIFTTN